MAHQDSTDNRTDVGVGTAEHGRSKARGREQLRSAYEAELYRQTHPYEVWIDRNERRLAAYAPVPECTLLEREAYFPETASKRGELLEVLSERSCEDSFILLVSNMGEMEPCAPTVMLERLRQHPEEDILYADEDLWTGQRSEPWFKPDWSPDTFLSLYYFGGLIAVRTSYLLRVLPQIPYQDVPKQWVRALVRGGETRPGHIAKILYHAEQKAWDLEEVTHERYSVDGALVSVIIPSKDHPELLARCLRTIRLRTSYEHYEVIVVDNGSSEENRRAMEEMAQEDGFRYLYQEEDFNFSRMCNRGAAQAGGDVFLFLNDDVEIIDEGWMETLAGQALQERTGAVGAKLYYPGGEKQIQHVGVANTAIGPLHKLCGMVDEGSIYHGRNLADYDVLAVTAACMAIARGKYQAAGGFSEELAVAYNDVDLCFTLHEKGWYNVVRNDVVLVHHESASRGADASIRQKRRQREEMRRLYARHPALRGVDPYYSPHLVQLRYDAGYAVGVACDYELPTTLSHVTTRRAPDESASRRDLRLIGLDPALAYHVDSVTQTLDDIVVIEGWAAPRKQPAYLYTRALLLRRADECLTATLYDKYRPDAEAALPEQSAGALAGWVARIESTKLMEGRYRIGLCYLRGSRETVRYTQTELVVEAEGVWLDEVAQEDSAG